MVCAYLLIYLFTDLLIYLFTYLLIHLFTYLLTYIELLNYSIIGFFTPWILRFF